MRKKLIILSLFFLAYFLSCFLVDLNMNFFIPSASGQTFTVGIHVLWDNYFFTNFTESSIKLERILVIILLIVIVINNSILGKKISNFFTKKAGKYSIIFFLYFLSCLLVDGQRNAFFNLFSGRQYSVHVNPIVDVYKFSTDLGNPIFKLDRLFIITFLALFLIYKWMQSHKTIIKQ